MSLLRTQSAPLQQFDNGNGASGAQPVEKSPLTAANNEQPFFRLDLLRSLQLHRRLALCIALAGVALAAAYVAMKWPIYVAQSQVYIQPVLPKIMNPGAPSHWPNDATTYDSFIEQQVHNSARPDVLLSVLHKLGPGGWQRGGESELAAAARLGSAVEVARMGATYQVGITAHASDPETAAKIANAMAESIVEKASSEQKAGDRERLGILRDEQQRVQKELDSDRGEQQVLNATLGVAAIGTATPDHYDDDISGIHEELVKARTAHDEAAARLMALGSNHEPAMNAEAEEQIAADPGLTSMKMALNQRRAALITQMANLTPNHPQYKQDAEEVAQINASLDSMMKDLRTKASMRIQQRLRTDLDRTAQIEGRLNAQLGQMAGAAASATPKLQRANDLATDILRLQNRLNVVDEQLYNLMLEDNVPGAAHLSVTAMAPLHPTVSGILRKALPVALGGIILGILAALIAYNLDPKVYTASDVEHVLGITPLAVLPDFDQVSDEAGEEHLLRLAAALEYAHRQKNLKDCLFTGAGPDTGVTTLSTRVRTMLETMGKPTVLVNASGTTPPENEDQNLVITDAAPLTVSAETEYLARFVDAAIVVVKSGATTRAQLLETARRLQRLNVTAVDFVLNRVRMETADPAFRRTVHATEAHLRTQHQQMGRRIAFQEPAPEPVFTESQPELPKEQAKHAVPRPPAVHELPVSKPETDFAKQTAIARTTASESKIMAELRHTPAAHAPEAAHRSLPEAETVVVEPVREMTAAKPAEQSESSMGMGAVPSPAVAPAAQAKTEEAARTSAPATAPRPVAPAAREEAQAANHFGANEARRAAEEELERRRGREKPAVQPTAPKQSTQPATAPARTETPAQTWESVAPAAETPKPAAAPVESEDKRGMGEGVAADPATHLSGLRNLLITLGLKNLNNAKHRTAGFEDVFPVYDPGKLHEHVSQPKPAADDRNKATTGPGRVIAQPEFLPPRTNAQTAGEDTQDTTRHERREIFDDIQILPSRHGQYRER